MKTDIFIRSYKGDIEWLKLALKSIFKHGSGFNKVILCYPENQKKYFDTLGLTQEKVVHCPVYQDDYLGQQVSKLNAWHYTDSEAIVFWDSDTIAVRPFSPNDFMEERKPLIYKTHYSKVGDAICWKAVTEKAIGVGIEFEYMRRLPAMYLHSTLKNIATFIHGKHGKSVESYVLEQPFRSFSEFNLIGAYSEIHESEKYIFKNTDNTDMPPIVARQFWSWGGITFEVEKEINNYI